MPNCVGYVYYENGQPNSPFVWALKSPFHIQREFCTSGEMKLECWLFTGTSNCRDLLCDVQFSGLDSMLTGTGIYDVTCSGFAYHIMDTTAS